LARRVSFDLAVTIKVVERPGTTAPISFG